MTSGPIKSRQILTDLDLRNNKIENDKNKKSITNIQLPKQPSTTGRINANYWSDKCQLLVR